MVVWRAFFEVFRTETLGEHFFHATPFFQNGHFWGKIHDRIQHQKLKVHVGKTRYENLKSGAKNSGNSLINSTNIIIECTGPQLWRCAQNYTPKSWLWNPQFNLNWFELLHHYMCDERSMFCTHFFTWSSIANFEINWFCIQMKAEKKIAVINLIEKSRVHT